MIPCDMMMTDWIDVEWGHLWAVKECQVPPKRVSSLQPSGPSRLSCLEAGFRRGKNPFRFNLCYLKRRVKIFQLWDVSNVLSQSVSRGLSRVGWCWKASLNAKCYQTTSFPFITMSTFCMALSVIHQVPQHTFTHNELIPLELVAEQSCGNLAAGSPHNDVIWCHISFIFLFLFLWVHIAAGKLTSVKDDKSKKAIPIKVLQARQTLDCSVVTAFNGLRGHTPFYLLDEAHAQKLHSHSKGNIKAGSFPVRLIISQACKKELWQMQ